MSSREHSQFLATWEYEAQSTLKLLRALPADKYDFRPDAQGRSLGELAWHLAEAEAYIAEGVLDRAFDFTRRLPGLERPRTVAELAPGYERVHQAYADRVRAMKPEGMDAMVPFMGRDMRAGELLWTALLHHEIHHRGELVILCRLAGGVPPGLYGPTREEWAAMQAKKG